jgi:hypothetical protein
VEEDVMSLAHDFVKTIGDALRLSSDVMRYKMVAQTRVIKRGVGRVAVCIAACMASLVLAAVGFGFILYGAFVLVAKAIGSAGAAGLIVGLAVLLIAAIVGVVGRSMMARP